MNTLIHPVAPEDVMALIDGELTGAETALVSQHIEQCPECAALRDQLRNTSESLSEWKVSPAPPALDQAIESRLATKARSNRPPRMITEFTRRNWRVWALSGGSAIFGVLALMVFGFSISYYSDHYKPERAERMVSSEPAAAPPQMDRPETAGLLERKSEPNTSQFVAPAAAPLIARTISLTVVVKNLDAARSSVDAILARHHGYFAQLTVLEGTTPHGLTGSLRIPVAELAAAIAEMRALGNVDRETQSGEEVTQQHADLEARLTNARETEARLRDILANRTGKMEDVLNVEDKISETRGVIEQLEAEQKNLEHRIEFASVDLEVVEQYEARLANPSASISNQVRNSFVAGLTHAGKSLLGLVLNLEEYGPVLLAWLTILGVPGILLWRLYQKVRNSRGTRL